MQLLWSLQEIIVNRREKGIVLAVVITASIFIIVIMSGLRTTTRFYKEGNKTPDNPERGFYVQADVEERDKIERYQEQVSLFLLAFDLYEYRNREIPQQKLEELALFFEEAKQQKVKCIFRAAYGFEKQESNDADSLECIKEHIAQIAPILNQYKNQICCVQAGFFGPWGEWHSSKYLEEEEMGKENRNWLLKELLGQLSEEIVIDVRRPRFIRDAWAVGLSRERIGFHNDGLLGSESDLGTYDDSEYTRAQEMEWLEKNLKTGLNGGEMPAVNEYSRAECAVEEFSKMKLSYLNLKYNEEVYEQWKEENVKGENAFEYIEKRLGYRFFVSKVKCPVSFEKGILKNRQKIELTLENQGFAPIGRNYELEWVVEDASGNIHCFKEKQPLEVIEAGGAVSIQLSLKELEGLQVEKIGIRIFMKNDEEKLSEYCVELVNDEVVYRNGVNYLIFLDEKGRIL